MFKSCSMEVSGVLLLFLSSWAGESVPLAFLGFLGGKVFHWHFWIFWEERCSMLHFWISWEEGVPRSGMGSCPNTRWSPVKMSSDIGASGCGMCKNFCFSGICWWLRIYKRDKIYNITFSTIIFLFCVCLFDIFLQEENIS